MKIMRLEDVITEGFPSGVGKRELSPEELKEAYALARAAFSAEDLQRFTEICEDIPAEQVLTELEEIQKRANERKE